MKESKSYLTKFLRFQEECFYVPRINMGTYFTEDPELIALKAKKFGIKDPKSVHDYVRTEEEARKRFE